VLFAIADDVKIAGPPEDLAEIVAQVPALSMLEAGLKIQATKNRIYAPSSARAGWAAYLAENPRPNDPSFLCLHDIRDGRLPPPLPSAMICITTMGSWDPLGRRTTGLKSYALH
jgi:hypothetical protein